MKRTLALFLLVLAAGILSAQDAPFDGTWIGYIYDDDDEITNYLLIEIDGDEVTQYGYNSEEESYYVMSFDMQKFMTNRNNALYAWLNQGGVWSETQTWHMSLVNKNKANIIWTRQVNNIKDGDNEVWDVSGKGTMERVVENTYNYPFVEAQSQKNFTIKSVTLTDEATVVVMNWSNSGESDIAGTFYGPGNENAMFITDQGRQKKFKIKEIDGVTFGVLKTIGPGDDIDVTLYFEPIGDLRRFDIIEPGKPGTTWNFYGVYLED